MSPPTFTPISEPKGEVQQVEPDVYGRYISELYQLPRHNLEGHPFVDLLAQSPTFVPFSSEKTIAVLADRARGVNVGRLEIDLSDACNFKCPGCTFQFNRKDERLPWYQFCDFAREIKRVKYRTVTLAGGGDPTEYNDSGRTLCDATEFLSELGIACFLITNGYAINSVEYADRLLRSVAAIRISYYDVIAPGEPLDKNEIVLRNIRRLVERRRVISSSCYIVVANLINPTSPRGYRTALHLKCQTGAVVTPRPTIAISRTADEYSQQRSVRALLEATMQTASSAEWNPGMQGIAMREFFERVLAYSLPLERQCAVTERGLIGKLRPSGDLFACGQLSAIPPHNRLVKGLADDLVSRNLRDDPRALEIHQKGHYDLPGFGACPTCRETLNNVRFNRFESITPSVRECIRDWALEAYRDGSNLAYFW